MKDSLEFLTVLYCGVWLTSGQSPRSTELSNLSFINSGRQRNLYIYDGRLVAVFEYSKTSWATDIERKTIRIILDDLGRIIQKYLVYIRPVETKIAYSSKTGIKTDPDLTATSRFLFSAFGKDIVRETFNKEISKRAKNFFDIRGSGAMITMSFLRHAMVHVGRYFVLHDIELKAKIQNLIDEQGGHTASVAIRHYAIPTVVTPGDRRYYTTFKEVSLAHHRFFGYEGGSGMCNSPYDLRKLTSSHHGKNRH
jgi:hypothetical protein